MRPNASLLDLLLEVQALDRVPRTGYLLRGVAEPESVTEHGWQVLFLVWSVGRNIPDLDLGRALELALLHDLPEVRVGDLPRTAARYLPEGAKESAELAAAREMLAPLPDGVDELLAEYQEGESLEARLVKDCDKLQLMLKVFVYESWGAEGLREFWGNPDNFPSERFAPVSELFAELKRRRDQSRA